MFRLKNDPKTLVPTIFPWKEPRLPILQDLRQPARRFKRDAVTLWFACGHPETPWLANALGGFVVAYALSPIDLIPDFIPVLGYVDDVLLLPGLIWLAIHLIRADVRAECQRQGDEWMALNGARPRTAWSLLFVAAVWVVIVWGECQYFCV